KIFGLFLNTIPFRLKLNKKKNCLDELLEVFNAKVKLQHYKHLPYGYIRSLFKQDLYDFAFNFVHFHVINDSLNYMESVDNYERTNIPFVLNISQYKEAEFYLKISVHDDYISKDYLDYFTLYYQECLNNILRNQDNKLYLTREDYSKIIKIWNQVDRDYPSDKAIHKLFEEQVEKTPENVALVYESVRLTYRELNARSNRLAHYLINTYEIKPDTLVVLCLGRSEHMLIGILAVLKAGGAYVPIDPSYPDERIKYILEDTGTKVVLTNEIYKQRLEDISKSALINRVNTELNYYPQILGIDSNKLQEELSLKLGTNLNTEVTSNNLSYVIYTSGTTGNPKGVLQLHGNVMRLFTATNDLYRFSSKDVWTLFHSYVFDFSVWEIWGALIYGGRLIIPSYEQTRDLHLFYELCKEQQVTILNQTPSAFYQFTNIAVTKDISNKLTTLNYVIFGGEALNISQLKPWFSYYDYNQPKLINMYGITETTVHVTYRLIGEQDLGENSYIGKIIPDLKTYVLDSNLSPLPIGAVGELYIGGVGLARGYLNRPELTAERFIANPFQSEEESRLDKNTRIYKTGDLVRWLPNGDLEYMGRNDFQVKIRGYRIELGEIESVLSLYEGIKQSVVLARDHINIDSTVTNNKYLVGYYVSELKLNEDEILNYLRARLPEYMVPSILVYLNELPLTINGKLDRRGLPDPEFGSRDNYVAPRNEIEKKVCQIWSEVLGLSEDKVGIRDDFFRLGGDSILAIRIVSKLNKEFNSQITVKDIFELRDVYRLIDIITNSNEKIELYVPFSLINIENYKNVISDINLVEDIYPASYLQMGMLLESTLNNQGTYNNVSAYSIRARYNENKFLSIWKSLVNKHELLRASFILNNDNGWNVVIYKNIEIIYQIHTNQNTEELISTERLNNFDYSIPGLFKLIINDLGSSFDFVLSFHHAVEDGWSMAFLTNEFIQSYINDQPIEPKLSIRYGEFVKNELAAIRNQTNIDFWKGYLNDLNITKVHWKFDTEISKNSLYSSSFSLSNEEVSLVHKIAKELRVSVD
ncbi:MAG: amino acid adenylation domain-containing protein, partial [Alphaproteobacteria bacterium]|nr:amino acid adenylation domain-containing protein [Alphaproteobacteria bacterium]